jgi:predicted RNase H-like HicB family nuclease
MNQEAVKKIKPMKPPFPFEAYAHVVSPLNAEDGGGFLITFPDLPGCMSDGETEAEAINNGRDAFASWVSSRIDAGKPVPDPAYSHEAVSSLSGRFVTRLPKFIHAKLADRAKAEGVSLNTLVLAFIAEGLGRKDVRL